MDEMPPDPFAPVRPTWLTAAMVSIGVVGAPLAILGLTLAVAAFDVAERAAAFSGFGGFVGLAVIVMAFRYVRPLGVGMLLGAVSMGGILLLAIT